MHDFDVRRVMTPPVLTSADVVMGSPAPASQAEDVACAALCRKVENAAVLYGLLYGVSTRNPRHLVTAGLLSEMPRCPDGGAIIISVLGPSVSVTCSKH